MSDRLSTIATAVRRLGCTPAEAAALLILGVAATAAVGFLWVMSQPPGPAASQPGSRGGRASEPAIAVTDAEVIVHVAGAVVRPGVYTLPGGSRVADAVEVAGGPRRRAVLDGLNLARVLTDGEQVVVPTAGTGTTPALGSAAPSAGSTPAPGGGAVSLNQATLVDLETLPGIGPVLAQRILDHRDAIGGFKTVDDLRDVSGIGEKTFQSLAPLVTP